PTHNPPAPTAPHGGMIPSSLCCLDCAEMPPFLATCLRRRGGDAVMGDPASGGSPALSRVPLDELIRSLQGQAAADEGRRPAQDRGLGAAPRGPLVLPQRRSRRPRGPGALRAALPGRHTQWRLWRLGPTSTVAADCGTATGGPAAETAGALAGSCCRRR
ncbi:unnamed protein product, partial [Prorocentrum cordatum]